MQHPTKKGQLYHGCKGSILTVLYFHFSGGDFHETIDDCRAKNTDLKPVYVVNQEFHGSTDIKQTTLIK